MVDLKVDNPRLAAMQSHRTEKNDSFEELTHGDVVVNHFAPNYLKDHSLLVKENLTPLQLVSGKPSQSVLKEKTVKQQQGAECKPAVAIIKSEAQPTSSSKEIKTIQDIESDPECRLALDGFSKALGYNVTPTDVMVLFFALLKLMNTSRTNEKLFRREEREIMIIEMKKVVENFKTQAQYTLMANVGGGLLMCVSGATPIVGHVAGDSILGKLQGVFSSLRGLEKEQFVKSVSKITNAMAEMYKSTGTIQNTFAQGNLNKAQHFHDLAKIDSEECNRTLDDLLQEWRTIINFLSHQLQMEHETARSLYN